VELPGCGWGRVWFLVLMGGLVSVGWGGGGRRRGFGVNWMDRGSGDGMWRGSVWGG
jgi:hypothetical protein